MGDETNLNPSSVVPSVDSNSVVEFQTYLETVRQRFSMEHFEIQDGLVIGKHKIDLFAFTRNRLRNSNVGFYFTYAETVTADVVKEFVNLALDHAYKFQAANYRSIYNFPVICSHVFDEYSVDLVRHYGAYLSVLQWPAGGAEHPVLVNLGADSLIHNEKRPFFLGRIAVGNAIQLTREYLASSPK